MVGEALIGHLVSEGINAIKVKFKNSSFRPKYKQKDLEGAIYDHITYVKNETKFISYKKTNKNKFLSDVYIDIDIELKPRSEKVFGSQNDKLIIDSIIKQKRKGDDEYDLDHIVIMGGPGAGKTTTVGHICRQFLGKKHSFSFSFPILINLRNIRNNESIYKKLTNILGLELYKNTDETIFNDEYKTQTIINTYLNSINSVVILDGLDEVEPGMLKGFHYEIYELMTSIDCSLIILTCRSASLNYDFSNCEEYELCDLNNNQVKLFVEKWFSNKEASSSFLTQLRNSRFYDLSIQPLTLAHLCAIFEKTDTFYDKPRSLYKRLINLLIEEWDSKRKVERETYVTRKDKFTEYSKFEVDEKRKFLSHFAYDLCVNYNTKVYTDEEFKESYYRIYDNHNLPKNQCEKVVKELEAHNGIIIRSGINTFLFYHKVIQEVLAAEYIVGLTRLPIEHINNSNISNELAIAISSSSNSTDSYVDFVYEKMKLVNISITFVTEFFSRLQYERPVFKKSILIPYSFLYIYHLLIKQDKIRTSERTNFEIHESLGNLEFNKKFDEIIVAFKKDNVIYNSFLHFNQLFKVNFSSGNQFYKVVFKNNLYHLLSSMESSYIESLGTLLVPVEFYDKHFLNQR